MACTETGPYHGPKPIVVEEPYTRFHSNTIIPPHEQAKGENPTFVRPAKGRGTCNPANVSAASMSQFNTPYPEREPMLTQGPEPSQMPAAGRPVPRHPVVRLGVLDSQGPTFNETNRKWELHEHDTSMPALNPDGSPALLPPSVGAEQWGWTIDNRGSAPHRNSGQAGDQAFTAWTSSTRSSQVRAERERQGPDQMYTRTLPSETSAGQSFGSVSRGVPVAADYQTIGASATAPFGTEHN